MLGVKTILYWTVSLAVALFGSFVTNGVIYMLMGAVGLQELGAMLVFKIGLAVAETAAWVLIASILSEGILFDDDDLDETWIFEEAE